MTRPTIERGHFGEISDRDLLKPFVAILHKAIGKGLLDAEYVDFDAKRRGSALNYDIYDVVKRPATLLLQRRETEGDKYGLHPQKTYLVLRRGVGGRLTVQYCPAPDQVVKVAKRIGNRPGAVLKDIARIVARRQKRMSKTAA